MPSPRHGLTISLVSTVSNNYFDFALEPHCEADHTFVSSIDSKSERAEHSSFLCCLEMAAQQWQNPSHICLAKARVFSLEPYLLLASGTQEMRNIHKYPLCPGLLHTPHADKQSLVV